MRVGEVWLGWFGISFKYKTFKIIFFIFGSFSNDWSKIWNICFWNFDQPCFKFDLSSPSKIIFHQSWFEQFNLDEKLTLKLFSVLFVWTSKLKGFEAARVFRSIATISNRYRWSGLKSEIEKSVLSDLNITNWRKSVSFGDTENTSTLKTSKVGGIILLEKTQSFTFKNYLVKLSENYYLGKTPNIKF